MNRTIILFAAALLCLSLLMSACAQKRNNTDPTAAESMKNLSVQSESLTANKTTRPFSETEGTSAPAETISTGSPTPSTPVLPTAVVGGETAVVYLICENILLPEIAEYRLPAQSVNVGDDQIAALTEVEKSLAYQNFFGTETYVNAFEFLRYFYNDFNTIVSRVRLPGGGKNSNCGECGYSEDGQLLWITERPFTGADCFILPKTELSFETDDDETIIRLAEEALSDFADFSQFEYKEVCWPQHVIWSNQKDGVDLPGRIDVYFSGPWVESIEQTHFYDLPLDHDLNIDFNGDNAASQALKNAFRYFYPNDPDLKDFKLIRGDYTQFEGCPAILVDIAYLTGGVRQCKMIVKFCDTTA